LDVENNIRRKLENSNFYVADQLDVYRGTQILFRCHLLMSDATTYYAPGASSTWLFGIDSSFTRDHADLVVSENAQFNVAGDWADTSVVGGKICWRADLTSQSLKDDLADDASKQMYACLWMCPSGGEYTLMAQWDINMKNVAVDPTTALAQDGISFLTMDLYNADMAQLKAPTSGLYRIQNGALQIWNADQSKYHTISISGAAGSETMDIGPGED
jgi:hypothetical protein